MAELCRLARLLFMRGLELDPDVMTLTPKLRPIVKFSTHAAGSFSGSHSHFVVTFWAPHGMAHKDVIILKLKGSFQLRFCCLNSLLVGLESLASD